MSYFHKLFCEIASLGIELVSVITLKDVKQTYPKYFSGRKLGFGVADWICV